MPNRSLLDACVGPVHLGNLGWVRSMTVVPDGAHTGGRNSVRRTTEFLDVRDEGHSVDVHQHLHQRLLPHLMRA